MSGTPSSGPKKRPYRLYVLAILMVTYVFSYMDRYILSILLEDIKAEFDLTDFQLGLLSGIAFAFFYSTLGIPIARLADRQSRVRIISVAVTLWSLFTAACGLAGNFVQLFLARVGVGVGEAGGLAPAHSLISDYFSPAERSRALSVYSLGPPFGALLGLVIGGMVAEAYGWRVAFYAVGLPGVLLGALVFTTLREPTRGQYDPNYDANKPKPGVFETLRVLWANKTYLYANLAHASSIVTAYAMTTWLPVVFLRGNPDLSKAEVGPIVGLTLVLGSVPGTLLGGLVADWLAKRDVRWRAWSPMWALLISIPIYSAALFAGDTLAMAVLFGLAGFCFQISFVPALAIVQNTVAPDMRALAAAFVFFLANFFGLGLGPVVVGALSDVFADGHGAQSINIALLLSLSFLLVGAVFFALTARTMNVQSDRS